MKQTFPFQPAALAMVVAAAFPAQAFAAGSAGVAQFIAGDVNVLRANGKTVALAKGKALESGESILTGNGGRAQVRFTDGGLVSLQPNTEFKIANYVDEADPKQDRFLVDLLRGSMRAITGLIGKRNRENYKVTTTTATIGIRGSGFSVGYNPDGSLGITTELDAIEVCNAGGCVGLTAGESVRVINSSQAPERTDERAKVPTPAPAQEVAVAGNQTKSNGEASVVPPPPEKPVTPVVTPPPPMVEKPPTKQIYTDLAVGVVFTDPATSSSPTVESYHPDANVAVLAGVLSGKPVDFSSLDSNSIRTDFRGTGATQVETGVLGAPADADFIGWGSWVTGEKVVARAATAIESVHYVMGRPTPPAQMPAAGLQGNYQLAGGTAYSSVHGAGQLVAGAMTANFGTGGQGYAYVDLTTRFGGTDYNASLNVDFNGARITGSEGVSASGFFSGNNASRAALVYSTPIESAGQVSGAAVFKQTSLGSPPS